MEYVLSFTIFVNSLTVGIEAVYSNRSDCERALEQVTEKGISLIEVKCNPKTRKE